MKLTASIVTYNTPEPELRKCLDVLKRNGVERIYIIDNSPTDNISEIISSHPAGSITEYIPRHDNPGYGAAHNIALRKAIDNDTEYHLVINSDVYFADNVLSEITEFMDSRPDTGLLQPRILSTDGSDQYSARLIPTPLDLVSKRFLPRALCQSRIDRYLLKKRPANMTLNIPYHQGSFMFFRVNALKKTGLFDERFFMYPEDIDISRRMHSSFLTLYWPKVTITHAHRASSYHSFRMLLVHATNMIKYFNKWGWFFDSSRKKYNKEIIDYIKKHPNT